MYPDAYIQFLVHFHCDRDYFECHEVLEDFWKHTDPGNKDSHWVGLILLAVSCYHHRRGNFAGASRTLRKSTDIFHRSSEAIFQSIGINKVLMKQLMERRLAEIDASKPFHDFSIPLEDNSLLPTCKMMCTEMGGEWEGLSCFAKNQLIHKHLFRDRSEVIQERNLAIEKRKEKKQ
ncbi:DUF309 domain-containing protein [Bacillus massilinigeriensis]|uniref:DUF309 domain-containing protein n=1 Tax=Bacillus mediterraneensis TaxID=1805474 RepID=UPI0008F87451|nr:DUF309 domain-containing protein [Bacillus mediterraneensis]